MSVAAGLAILLTASWLHARDDAQDMDLFGKVIQEIQYIQEDTNQLLKSARYDRCIALQAGVDRLTHTNVKAAIQDLYETGSFSEIAALASAQGEGVLLQFRVRLSTYFNRFFISGGVDLGGGFAAEAMALPAGERFTEARLEAARQSVLKYVRERGFYQAHITRTELAKNGAQVDTAFEVELGLQATIRALTIHGVPANETTAIRERLGLKEGQKYDQDRFLKRLAGLKKNLVDRGFLEADPQLAEPSYDPADNTVALDLAIAKFGQVRVEINGFKIPRDQLSRLLPVLSGEGLRPELLEEGTMNLQEYLEERGYPEAEIRYQDSLEPSGVRLIRYNIDRGRRVTVSEVRFRGNRDFVEADLLRTIQIQPARFLQKSAYSVSKLDSDVEALHARYRTAGYLDATIVPLVELMGGEEKLRITFECSEGTLARIGSVRITGNLHRPARGNAMRRSAPFRVEITGIISLPAQALVGKMRLKRGEPYSPYLAEYDRQAIQAAYNDAGFLQPAVTYRAVGPDKNQNYAVVFVIDEGVQTRVDNVIVLGKEQTRDSVIEKRLRLKQDDPMSLGKMLETQQAIYGTGVFDLVRVAPQNPESNAAYQNVIVRLQEARPITLRYGLGYQEREKMRGILELSHLNLFGLGRRVDLRFRGSAIEQAGALSFQQPQIRFLPVDSYFIFSGSYKKEVSFDVRRLDLSYQYSHSINDHTWGLLRYNFTNVRVANAPPDLAREETPRNLSTISAIYVKDTRDSLLDPKMGFSSSTDLSLTAKLPEPLLGSGFYLSLFTQNSYHRKLGGPLLMTASFRFGLHQPVSGDRSIPLSERFFAGGGSSLRGFETDRAGPLDPNNAPIGGNALLIGNLELRVPSPFVSRLELAGFYDIGNVFSNVGAMRFRDFSHTVGVGLRVKTPLGPIRLDYGINLNLSRYLRSIGYKPGHFFLTIGQLF